MTPRSGKSSIAGAIQDTFEGVWMNIGVDRYMQMIPSRYQPGLGLRPGRERPDLELLIQTLYKAMYESIAVHSRLGINVVADVGHHEGYSAPLKNLTNCSHILKGLPVLFVGVRSPIVTIMERRIATWKKGYEKDGSVPEPVKLWQELVHVPGIYDLELDTSVHTPDKCAELIKEHLKEGKPSEAFGRISDL